MGCVENFTECHIICCFMSLMVTFRMAILMNNKVNHMLSWMMDVFTRNDI